MNNSNVNYDLSGDLFDDDSLENSKDSSNESEESVINLFGDSEQISAKKKRKRKRKKKGTTDSNLLIENSENKENNTTKSDVKTSLQPEELLFSNVVSDVGFDEAENSIEFPSQPEVELLHDNEINSLFENDATENDATENTDTISIRSNDSNSNIFKDEDANETKTDSSTELDNSVSIIEVSDDTNSDNDDLSSFFDKDINSSSLSIKEAQETQKAMFSEKNTESETILNNPTYEHSENEDNFFEVDIPSSNYEPSEVNDNNKEYNEENVFSDDVENNSTIQDDYLDSLLDDLLVDNNNGKKTSDIVLLNDEFENNSDNTQEESFSFNEKVENINNDEDEFSIIPDDSNDFNSSTNDSFDFDDNLDENFEEVETDNDQNILEPSYTVEINDLSDLDALADEKDDFDLIVADNDDNNDSTDLNNLLFDDGNETESEIESSIEEKSDPLSLNEDKSDKEKKFASMIDLIDDDDDFSPSDESDEFDNSIEAPIEIPIEIPVETESIMPQPLREDNDDVFELSEETNNSQENQETQGFLKETKETEKAEEVDNDFDFESEMQKESLEESVPEAPAFVAAKPATSSLNLIANRYRFVSSVYSNELYSNYITNDSVTGEDVDILEIHNPEYFDFVIDKAKKLNKFNGNPNLPHIKRVFKNNNKVYIVKNIIECSSFENFVCDTEPNWATISVVMLELIRTVVKLRRLGFNFFITPQNVFFNNDSLVLKNIFEAELDLADEYIVRHEDVFDVCSLFYYYITGIPFNSEDVRPLEQFISINEKDSDLILRGLNVVPYSGKKTLVNLYNEMSSETTKLYDTSVFKISEFSMNSPKKMLRNERKFNKKQKKEKKRRIKKYKRKVRIISTILAFIVLSAVALFGVYKIAPDLFKQVFPSISHFVSPSDVSKSDEPTLYVYSDKDTDENVIPVPDLIGKNYDWVKESVKYQDFDIRCIREEYNETIEKGDIISQTIEQGSSVKRATPIGVVVSMGSLRDAIPSLTGKTVEEAQYLLESIGLYIGKQTEEYNADIPAGCIVSMIEPDGELVSGAFIDVIVSLGNNTSDSTSMPIETQSTTNTTSSSTKKVVRSSMPTTKVVTTTKEKTTVTTRTTVTSSKKTTTTSLPIIKNDEDENSGGAIVDLSEDDVYINLD